MRTYKLTILLLFSTCTFTWGQQSRVNSVHNKELAQKIVHQTLAADSLRKDKRSSLILLQDSAQVIAIAEQILFKAYGQKHILDQRPYHLYNIDNYWIMFGTLHYSKGGTFNIIIDAYDCRVLDMYHEK